jgi:hypothetical protein
MKTYYKQIDENGKIVALLTYDIEPNITDPLIVGITAEEYNSIADVWKAEGKAKAEARAAERRAKAKEKALKAKAYDIITGVE